MKQYVDVIVRMLALGLALLLVAGFYLLIYCLEPR